MLNSLDGQPITAPNWFENFKTVSFILFGFSLGCLILHWALSEFFSSQVKNSLPNFLLKEAGMAGLIALFLNLSIEWINRKRHASHQEALLSKLDSKHEETSKKLLLDVNKQLFKTVYERNIDEHVFDQVEEHLLRAKTMRKGFATLFKLTRFVDPATNNSTEFVQLECCNDYQLSNLTDKPIKVFVVKALVDVTPKYRQHCKFHRVSIGDDVIEGAELDKMVETVDGRNFILLKIEREVPPNDSVPVRVEYKKLAPIDYAEIVVTTIPMDGLILEVIDPLECFTVEAVSLHPEDETLRTPSDQKYLRRWHIEHAILPGQGIVMLWHPNGAKTEPAGG